MRMNEYLCSTFEFDSTSAKKKPLPLFYISFGGDQRKVWKLWYFVILTNGSLTLESNFVKTNV